MRRRDVANKKTWTTYLDISSCSLELYKLAQQEWCDWRHCQTEHMRCAARAGRTDIVEYILRDVIPQTSHLAVASHAFDACISATKHAHETTALAAFKIYRSLSPALRQYDSRSRREDPLVLDALGAGASTLAMAYIKDWGVAISDRCISLAASMRDFDAVVRLVELGARPCRYVWEELTLAGDLRTLEFLGDEFPDLVPRARIQALAIENGQEAIADWADPVWLLP